MSDYRRANPKYFWLLASVCSCVRIQRRLQDPLGDLTALFRVYELCVSMSSTIRIRALCTNTSFHRQLDPSQRKSSNVPKIVIPRFLVVPIGRSVHPNLEYLCPPSRRPRPSSLKHTCVCPVPHPELVMQVALECLSVLKDSVSWLCRTRSQGEELQKGIVQSEKHATSKTTAAMAPQPNASEHDSHAATACVASTVPVVIDCFSRDRLRAPAEDVLAKFAVEEASDLILLTEDAVFGAPLGLGEIF